MPIVGDSKYDNGARHLRNNGMYLCCHSLEFPYCITAEAIITSDGCCIEHLAAKESLHDSKLRVSVNLPCKSHARMVANPKHPFGLTRQILVFLLYGSKIRMCLLVFGYKMLSSSCGRVLGRIALVGACG
jgi:hypothetical protein